VITGARQQQESARSKSCCKTAPSMARRSAKIATFDKHVVETESEQQRKEA